MEGSLSSYGSLVPDSTVLASTGNQLSAGVLLTEELERSVEDDLEYCSEVRTYLQF